MSKGIKYALVFTGGVAVGIGVCGAELISYALNDEDIREGIKNKISRKIDKRNFKEELKNYFWDYDDRMDKDDGTKLLSYYSGFKTDIFEETVGGKKKVTEEKEKTDNRDSGRNWLQFTEGPSIFDDECGDCPAQYATTKETPTKPWDNVTSKLSEIDTSRLHYVKIPENHIVIDFDIKDEEGNKSFEKNLEAASKWPPTYAELSKSGGGIHLHYR